MYPGVQPVHVAAQLVHVLVELVDVAAQRQQAGLAADVVTHLVAEAVERLAGPAEQAPRALVRLLVLEFSHPVHKPLSKLYDLYSFAVWPRLGKLVVNDSESYRYLAESIRMHPDQDTLKGMMTEAGFQRSEYFNMLGGIVALHRGFKV